MEAQTIRTIGVLLAIFGALVATAGAVVPDVSVGGSASGGGGETSGSVEVGLGDDVTWAGIGVMVLGVVLDWLPACSRPGHGLASRPN